MPVQLIEKIKSGAYADVWRGQDSLEREVAIKIVRSSSAAISSALDHAKALAKTNHVNVVSVFSVDEVIDPESGAKVPCVVMELLEGETLAERLTSQRFLLTEAREIGTSIIDGLAHIHSQGLAHGDFHNENIMVDGVNVKIIDILYLDTLAALTTQSRQEKLRRDLVLNQAYLSRHSGRCSTSRRIRFGSGGGRGLPRGSSVCG